MQLGALWVWIDGHVISADQARVGVLDHGFLYGDSIYETLRSYDGQLFRSDDHLERLEASAEAIGLSTPWTRVDWRAILEDVSARGPTDHDVGLRLMITRGEGPLGLDTSRCPAPRLLVFGWPIPRGNHPLVTEGVDVIVSTVRRNPPSALDPRIKSGNFLNNILAYREVMAAGAYEGILCTVDGAVAEGTTSNIFWVRGGEVCTSEDRGILLGVTRRTVLEILTEEKINERRGAFPPEDLQKADEAFLTSTLKGILPIRKIAGKVLPVPGPVTVRITAAYDARTRARPPEGAGSAGTGE